MRCSGQRHAARESVGVLGEDETLLHQRIDGVLAFVGVILRALVAFLEREARIAVRKALLLGGGEGDVGARKTTQFSGGKSFGANIPS